MKQSILSISFLLMLCVFAGSDHVYYEPGEIPIIITAGHGGREKNPKIPVRNNKKTGDKYFVLLSDMYTAELAEESARNIEESTGKRPYLIINMLHRKFMDPNREPQLAYECKAAREVYWEYHNCIRHAAEEIRMKYKQGIIIDIHGQNKLPDDMYIGTVRGDTCRWMLALKHDTLIGINSIPGQLSFKYSVYGYKNGIAPRVVQNPDFNGGFTVMFHSQWRGMNAIQIEFHSRLRFDSEIRAVLAADLADAAVIFMNSYLLN